MKVKSRRLFSLCIVVSLLMSMVCFTSTASAAVSAQKSRLYGSDRIQTAIEISKSGWKTSSDYAVLVTANNFPDALCAAPLAKQYNAPLLLTESSALNSSVRAELQRLNVRNVIIVGGTGVVSDTVFNSVKEFASVQRIAGANREETSVEVAKRLGSPKTAVLATGLDFPDALSISSIAAAKGMPILLTGRDVLNDKVDRYLKDYGISSTYIVGGTGAISSAVEGKVPGPVRLAGSGRIQTNYEILSKFADSLSFNKVYLATAMDFPDALAGSALAAMSSSPIILADGPVFASTGSLVKNYIKENAEIIGLGGMAVVSDSTVDGLVSNLNGEVTVPGTLGVQSTIAVNRTQIKVVFSEAVEESSAESSYNYLLDGVPLSSSDKLILQPDRRTLYINMDRPIEQYATKLFVVKDKSVFTSDSTKMIPKYEKVLTFTDTDVPYIKSAAASGDRTITIEFSEPVMMPSSLIAAVETSFKLDGQYLANYGYSSGKAIDPTLMNTYSDKLELNFGTALPMGTHTLSLPAGTTTELVDASGYMVEKASVTFNVDTVSSAPRIVNVTGQNNGTVYVTYDRAMDSSTAEGEFLYKIGVWSAMAADFVSGSGNRVVKLVFESNVVRSGANVLVIDKDIKDSNGNYLDDEDDLNVSLIASEDKVKPTVLSLNATDDRHIRVKYSEPVDYTYATEKANYTLVDTDGFTVNYISSIAGEGGAFTDTFSLTLNTALNSSGYKLKIKNIIDRASIANTIDEYEGAINVSDSAAPTLVEEIVPLNSSSQVIVFFSEPMDPASVTSKTNVAYKNGEGNYKELPTGASIEMGIDKRSITVTFPTGYTVRPSGSISAYDVRGIRVANGKDLAGNLLADVVGYKDVVFANNAATKPTYIENSFKLYANGENIRAELELSQALAILRISDFRVTGQTPDSGYISDKKVILNFTDAAKVTAIRLAGPKANLFSSSTGSANVAGVNMAYISTTEVYDDRIAPRLISVSATSGGDDIVSLKFSERIDDEIPGLYMDDFTFLGGGTGISPRSVTVSYDTVIYYFNSSSFDKGSTVIVKAVESNASIRDLEDNSNDQNVYHPIIEDVRGISTTAN